MPPLPERSEEHDGWRMPAIERDHEEYKPTHLRVAGSARPMWRRLNGRPAPDGWERIRALATLHGVLQPGGDQRTMRRGDLGYAPARVVHRLERRGYAEVVHED